METEPVQNPNVLWVFGDQHRGQAIGCAGDPNVSTPNADRMAEEGLWFPNAVAGFPLCCPFRGSLLTGMYPHKVVPGHEYPMATGHPTIAHPFREAGYHTAYFGKWHVDGWKERDGRAAFHTIPRERRGGFDQWLGYDNNNSQWDSWVHGEIDGKEEMFRLPSYETDALADILIDYLRERGENHLGEPFFAVLSVQPPHNPYVAPEEWMRRHSAASIQLRGNVPAVPRIVEQARRELAGYYAQIENLDWNLGRIRQTLHDTGLAHRTHVLFFSDHGDMHGSHGQFKKTSPWEESIRIPFIMGGFVPRYACRSGKTPVLVNHVDIAPTTLGLCGINPPEWMEGEDLSGHRVKGGTAPTPDSAFIQSVIPTGHGDSVDRPWRGIISSDGWKYVVLEGQPWLLFNLSEDPLEQVNLAFNTKYKAERKRLQERLAVWIHDTDDEFNLPEI